YVGGRLLELAGPDISTLSYLRRVTDPAELNHATLVQLPFHQFITKQREHTPAEKQRSRIAIPINTRSTTVVVLHLLILCIQLSKHTKLKRFVAQKQQRRRILKQMLVAWPPGFANRQSKRSGVFTIRLVKETMTPQLTLRRRLTRVTRNQLGPWLQPHRSKV